MSPLILSSTILLAAALLSFALRQASSSTRHAVWALGLLSAALLPLASAGLPELDLPLLPPPQAHAVVLASVSNAPLAKDLEATPAASGRSSVVKTPRRLLLRQWLRQYGLAVFWTIGFVLVLTRFILAVLAVRRLAGSSRPAENGVWQKPLAEMKQRLQVRQTVRLVIGNGVPAPMSWGVFQNVILLPTSASQWTEERRQFVLAHELAHVKRRDGFLQAAVQFASAMYWFNPLMWLAATQLRFERERACDDRVLSLGLNAHDYAGHLVELARSGRHPQLSQAAMSMTHPSQLETRLRSILDVQRKRQPMSRYAAATLLCATVSLTVLLATTRLTALPLAPEQVQPFPPALLPQLSMPAVAIPVPIPSPAAAPASVQAITPPAQPVDSSRALQKWIDEDVAYIITDDERKAFKLLQTGDEQEQFIDNFWLHRDPTPASAENEYKEAYYSRIAEANERFGFSNVAGWQTDRGHIYIVNGKPDSIESHPAGATYQRPPTQGGGTTEVYPFEIWSYRHLEGVGNNVTFEFVDPGKTGAYGLLKPPAKIPLRESQASPLPFEVHVNFAQGADEPSVAVIVGLQYKDLAFRVEQGTHISENQLDAQFTRPDGRIAEKFSDDFSKTIPDSGFEQTQTSSFNYLKKVSLLPGDYKLDITITDTNSGRTGTVSRQISVPKIPNDR